MHGAKSLCCLLRNEEGEEVIYYTICGYNACVCDTET